jgi:hypothetical protein
MQGLADRCDRGRLWFQFAFHRLASPAAAATFRGDEELSPAAGAPGRRTAAIPGRRTRARSSSGRRRWRPGADGAARVRRPGTVTGLRIALPRAAWSTTRCARLRRRRRADLPSPTSSRPSRHRARGRRSSASTRTTVSTPGSPCRSRSGAVLTLRNTGGRRGAGLVRGAPAARAAARRQRALRRGRAQRTDETAIGADIPLATCAAPAASSGLFADLSSVDVPLREYLEGDERVYVDGSLHPALYGTGVEDLFGGGFYFDEGPFRLATHGSPSHDATPSGEDRTSMYRLFLTDAVPFTSRLRFGLEGGPTGELALRARRVAWYYQRPEPALVRRRELVVGDQASRAAARYTVGAPETCLVRSGAWEGEPLVWSEEVSCERGRGRSRFSFHVGARPSALRLRRRFDATGGEQAAAVFVNGARVGAFPATEPNAFRPFREIDLDLPAGLVPADGVLRFEIAPAAGARFTEMRWELWATPPAAP